MNHPYGYSNLMYVVSLISGVGIFCLGAAVSIYSGILTLIKENELLNFREIFWAFLVLVFSATTEGICFICSVVATYRDAKSNNYDFFYYGWFPPPPTLSLPPHNI